MDIIDINKEFSLLTTLVNDLWDGCDTDVARKSLTVSFEQGLEDAKLWIDEYATMRIAEVLNGNDEICLPLEKRVGFDFEGDPVAYLYDALCRFDSNLSSGLSNINRSVTGYKRWDFSKNADAVCRQIKNSFGNVAVTPKNQTDETQKAIVIAYSGHLAEETRSYSTPQKLLKRVVKYNRDEQGYSVFRSLFSTVYSHGLYCAKTKNTQILISDLLPIYRKRDEPLNFDNGDDILFQAINNPFVALIHEMQPFTFFSTKEYLAAKEKALKVKARLANETVEQKKQRIESLIDISSLNTRIENEENKVDAFVDSIISSIKGYKLS